MRRKYQRSDDELSPQHLQLHSSTMFGLNGVNNGCRTIEHIWHEKENLLQERERERDKQSAPYIKLGEQMCAGEVSAIIFSLRYIVALLVASSGVTALFRAEAVKHRVTIWKDVSKLFFIVGSSFPLVFH